MLQFLQLSVPANCAAVLLLAMTAWAETTEHDPSALPEATRITEAARSFVPAQVVERSAPSYPGRELRQGNEGWVLVNYCIDEAGKPQNLSIADSTGNSGFERAALRAVRDWQYEPAKLDGKASWQSNNHVYLTFAVSQDERGARPPYIREHKKALRLLEENDLDGAAEILERVASRDDLNLYEYAKFWELRARYAGLAGDLRLFDLALHRATASEGKWIGRESHAQLLALRVGVDLELGHYGASLAAHSELVELLGEDHELVARSTAMTDQLLAIIDGDQVLATDGEIRPRGECHNCFDDWSFSPVRRRLSFVDVVGRIDTIRMRCTHKHYEAPFSGAVEWQIPESWGGCHVTLSGELGARFRALQWPET